MISKSLPHVLVLGSIYGTSLIASRFSVGQFDPIAYVALRLLLASLGYLFMYMFSFQGRSIPKDKQLWKHGILLGVFGTAIPISFIVMSLQYQSSGLTAILITLSPAMTVLLAHYFLHDEPLTRTKGLGIGLALVGAVLLSILGESGLPDVTRVNPTGYILVIVGMLFGSTMIIYSRKYMSGLSAFDVGAVRMITATMIVLPISLFVIGIDLSKVNQIGYLALGWASFVGTLAGMLLEFYIIKRFGATSAAMTAYVIPIVAGIGGVFMLGESFTPGMLQGTALIIIGISFINRTSPKRNLPEIKPI
ncbi:MAG: DMT family transporter [Chloroflexota bacterium]